MMYLELKRLDGSILFSNIEQCAENGIFAGDETKNVKKGKVRNLFQTNQFGSARLLIKDEGDYLYSKSLTKRLLNSCQELYHVFALHEQRSKEQFEKAVSRFAHNLIEVQAQMKDKAARIFDSRVQHANDYREQKQLVKENIEKNIDKAVDDF